MKAGNLSAAFTENTVAEARAAAIAWIKAQPLIEAWTLIGLWRPRADRPLFWRAEFDVTYRARERTS